MIVANSDFAHTSKSLFWPDVIRLAAVDLDMMHSMAMAFGIQRQTERNPNVKGEEGFDRTDSVLEGLGARWTASFLEKFYYSLSRYLISEFLLAVTELSIVEILGLFMTFGA